MKHVRRCSLITSWIGSLLASCSIAAECQLDEVAQPLYTTEAALQTHRLDNGLLVYMLQQDASHTVSITSQFQVGSAHEPVGQSGYAHLFEHLLFKGSEQAPGESYAAQLQALGAQFNANTHFDYTRYYLTLPAVGLELALFLESDRFIRPLLTAATIDNQKAAVLEEMALRIDNQAYVRQAMAFLLQQVSNTPYAHAIIGSKADLNQASVELLQQFHQRHYRPNKMQLSLVGNIPAQTLTWIEHYFGTWQPSKTNTAPLAVLEIEPQSTHGQIIDTRGPWPGLLLAWHTVGQHHLDAAAITLLELYLFQHITSLLHQQNLAEQSYFLHRSIPFSLNLHGISNVLLVPRPHVSLDELSEKVTHLLRQAAITPVSNQSICLLKSSWLANTLKVLEQPQALANWLAATPPATRHPLTAQWQRINQVSAVDLQRVAQQYFVNKTVRLDLLPPWYIRWLKRVGEWLPENVTRYFEDLFL